MRVMLLGGSGQLGTEIRRRWRDHEIYAPSSSQLDIRNQEDVEAAFRTGSFEAVVNCAAFHHVDKCESEPARAFDINAIAVDRVAQLCSDRGCIFVTISTDYVFDGEARNRDSRVNEPYTEGDEARPISIYGVSKFAGELLVDRLQMRALVVRTSGLYGTTISSSKGYTFIDRIIAQARAGEPLRIVNDIISSPTFAGHLAEAIEGLVETSQYGLYHAVNDGAVSWYAFAAETLRQAGLSGEIEAVESATQRAAARRPKFSALSNGKLHSLGIVMPSWRDGIRDYLAQRSLLESS